MDLAVVNAESEIKDVNENFYLPSKLVKWESKLEKYYEFASKNNQELTETIYVVKNIQKIRIDK